ncbi:sensor domain-containing diguanylate cyclase [Butyrivibrio sp. INlla21]|uniref:sensor domain-containing diguanylate cyclase n=1 Tax=Butyrivibrio sp. INlla21 TaxID=1520811 RepID=UPI0008E94E73|nr:GGDEF domain-containing protein [Butyrivibrio sp. INlla21]SFV01796.1 diguanylate cyclase (GGDEF) domain-containing protein [Butyrivibrio sp. INlla21]
MDFQTFVDGLKPMACVLSVEKKEDGGYGEIRIVAGNKPFVEFAEHPLFAVTPGTIIGKFRKNNLYDKYLPKTPDFEHKCHQSAILKKPVHTYLNINVANLWFNLFFLPLDYEEGNLCYCAFLNEKVDVDDIDMASSSSMNISNDVMKTCIKLRGSSDFKATINEVIHDVRKLCGAEICTISLVNQSEGTLSLLATSKADDCSIRPLDQYPNQYDVTMSWLDMIGERDSVLIQSEQDFEYVKEVNPQWYQTLIESGVKSIIIFPLRHNWELMGFIWATNFDTNNTSRIKETLEFTTFFISSEIASYIMLKKLEHVSYTDMLTGVFNSNAMNSMILDVVSKKSFIPKPYGVVFADINGLKRVNDESGHQAGDILIKKAALLLQEVFLDQDIYRAGGDEFMIVVKGCTKEEFFEKIDELKERTSDPDKVCLSVGCVFNDSDLSIRDCLRISDEEMYKNKDKFYEDHPEIDRRKG